MNRLLRFAMLAATALALPVAARAQTPPAAAAAATATIVGTVEGPLPTHAVVWIEGAPLPKPKPSASPIKITPTGIRIDPYFTVIEAGQSVEFPQVDALVHNLHGFSNRKVAFELGSYGRGKSKSVRFDKPGTVEVFCHIHETTHASIAVMPSPLYAVLDGSGHFTIAGIPPGRHVLRAYSPDGGTILLRLELKPGQSLAQTLRFPRHDPPEDKQPPPDSPRDDNAPPPQFRGAIPAK